MIPPQRPTASPQAANLLTLKSMKFHEIHQKPMKIYEIYENHENSNILRLEGGLGGGVGLGCHSVLTGRQLSDLEIHEIL